LAKLENSAVSEPLLVTNGNPYPHLPQLYDFEKSLFPWTPGEYRSILDFRNSFSGRGLVVPCGKFHFQYLVHFIKTVRFLGSELPILVAYAGEDDLPSSYRNYLSKLNMNVNTLDVYKFIKDNTISGWSVKPYALLVAPFEEVILCDADTVWMQRPEVLFDDIGYKTHKALIFRDRSLFAGHEDETNWLDANLPLPLSDRVLNSRMYKKLTAHEQESGASVYNKREHLFGVLASSKLMGKIEREAFYKVFHGDKESFWIGLEMANESYTDTRPWAGNVGWLRKNPRTEEMEVCGHMAHFDRKGSLLWFNGGILHDKIFDGPKLGNFTHYAYAGEADSWSFDTYFCNKEGVTAFTKAESLLFDGLKTLYQHQIDPSKDP